MEKDKTGQSTFGEVVRAPIIREPLFPYDENMQRDILRGEGEGLGIINPPAIPRETTSNISTKESE